MTSGVLNGATTGLNIAIADYGHTRALKSGAVPIEGIEPNFIEVKPIIGAFRRMVRDVEFDVCEMAPTTYMIARALGAPFIAIPVVVMRRFHHGGFVVRPDSGIKLPKDLEGKKVGVRAYSVTTGVWTRGIFVNEHGLDSSKVTWVVDDEEHVTTLKLPPNVVHAPPGKSLADMMRAASCKQIHGNAGIGRSGHPRRVECTGECRRLSRTDPECCPGRSRLVPADRYLSNSWGDCHKDRSALEASLGRPRPVRRFRGSEETLYRGSQVGKRRLRGR
jgi:hypothetical protein